MYYIRGGNPAKCVTSEVGIFVGIGNPALFQIFDLGLLHHQPISIGLVDLTICIASFVASSKACKYEWEEKYVTLSRSASDKLDAQF